MKQYVIRYKGKKIIADNYILCDSLFSQMRGLMFRSKKFKKSLVFTFDKPVQIAIHSLFVNSDFRAIWLRNGKVVDVQTVKPYRLYVKPKEKFDTLIEIPII
jgi:uncharacterized membrane protein (UPF0127 family)